jgi:hypothetical protein
MKTETIGETTLEQISETQYVLKGAMPPMRQMLFVNAMQSLNFHASWQGDDVLFVRPQ